MNTSEKKCRKTVEGKWEEKEEVLLKEKDISEEPCVMWKGVLETIDKNMI